MSRFTSFTREIAHPAENAAAKMLMESKYNQSDVTGTQTFFYPYTDYIRTVSMRRSNKGA